MPLLHNRKTRHNPQWSFNITPLVDIVFQLIVFFMVVSQVVSGHNESMRVPDPDRSQADKQSADKYTVVNLFASAGGTVGKIKVNATILPNIPALTDLLLRHSEQFKGNKTKLLVRADQQIQYRYVRQVLQAISNAGVSSLELAAQLKKSDE